MAKPKRAAIKPPALDMGWMSHLPPERWPAHWRERDLANPWWLVSWHDGAQRHVRVVRTVELPAANVAARGAMTTTINLTAELARVDASLVESLDKRAALASDE